MTQSIRDTAQRIAFNARQAMIDYGKAFKRDDNDGIRDSTTRACDAIDALIALAATQPTADERVAEHMRLVAAYGAQVQRDAFSGASLTLKLDVHDPDYSRIVAVEASARALLSASQEDAEHAAMYRWLAESSETGSNERCIMKDKMRYLMCFQYFCTRQELDAAIRAAMSAKETK